MNNFFKLPNGDFINLDSIEKIKFTSEEDTQSIKHLVCEISFSCDICHYRDNDAIFIKDYLDRNGSDFIVVNKRDHAVQSVGFAIAVEWLSGLSKIPPDDIVTNISREANQQVLDSHKSLIDVICEDYLQNTGKNIAFTSGQIKA
ncbi:MAG: hypothetical protein EAZ76_10825 [Nostocales cyanobacterium]|nr:MAG: hypothetical protein EAZ87_11860 [Nostocales cyanobacterium]TAF13794.1 MAG: hypothetical protein EAZ76_10825 [Nostocales cyanobacterium]